MYIHTLRLVDDTESFVGQESKEVSSQVTVYVNHDKDVSKYPFFLSILQSSLFPLFVCKSLYFLKYLIP